MAGWATSVARRSTEVGRGPPASSSIGRAGDRSESPRLRGRRPRSAEAEGGVEHRPGTRQARSRSIPTYCDPWPGNSTARPPRLGPGAVGRRLPVRRPGSVGESSRASPGPLDQLRPRGCHSAPGGHDGQEPARVSKSGRDRATGRLRSGRRLPGVVRAARRRAWPSGSEAGSRGSEKATIWSSPSQATGAGSGSASSRTQWKLVPPNPKALTAARRGVVGRLGSQGRASVLR